MFQTKPSRQWWIQPLTGPVRPGDVVLGWDNLSRHGHGCLYVVHNRRPDRPRNSFDKFPLRQVPSWRWNNDAWRWEFAAELATVAILLDGYGSALRLEPGAVSWLTFQLGYDPNARQLSQPTPLRYSRPCPEPPVIAHPERCIHALRWEVCAYCNPIRRRRR